MATRHRLKCSSTAVVVDFFSVSNLAEDARCFEMKLLRLAFDGCVGSLLQTWRTHQALSARRLPRVQTDFGCLKRVQSEMMVDGRVMSDQACQFSLRYIKARPMRR
eukprot:699312-Rhodomonas_salina.1